MPARGAGTTEPEPASDAFWALTWYPSPRTIGDPARWLHDDHSPPAVATASDPTPIPEPGDETPGVTRGDDGRSARMATLASIAVLRLSVTTILLRRNLTLRSGVTLERRRVLTEAGAHLAAHPALKSCYVSHVTP